MRLSWGFDNIIPIYNQRMVKVDTVQVFVVQKLALHQNGVEFCRQSASNKSVYSTKQTACSNSTNNIVTSSFVKNLNNQHLEMEINYLKVLLFVQIYY